ncbi:MAG: hypothetical protein LBT71_09255 [Azoarcus sp.]|jgi:general secretion pathway protein D|nr:hypothetical protein [Azoarcus sp.]
MKFSRKASDGRPWPRALALALALALPGALSHAAPPAGKTMPGDVYLKQITLDEAAQFISQVGNASIVVTSSVANKVVSLYLRDATVEGMVKNLARAAGVWYRHDAQTNAYILMDGKEYRQDIAITRDEITRNFVLRHHNVVSVANAVAALFGERVNLVEPVEEMPPLEMGSTTRTQSGTGGSRSSSGSGNDFGGNRGAGTGGSFGNSSGRGTSMSAEGAVTRRSGGSRGGNRTDAREELAKVSQAGLEASLDIDSGETETVEASRLQQAVSTQGPPIHLTYNKMHNLLLVRTSDETALQDIEKLVQDMDRPPRQVLLEMRIVEVELGGDFRSVFDIGFADSSSSGPRGLGHGSPIDGAYTDAAGNTRYPGNAASLGNFSPEQAATAVWQLVNNSLRMRLQLLESENRVNVLATPMLVASNNQPARLFIGDEQILITGAESDSTTGTTGATNTTITVETERRNVGQTLIILPRINADRTVTLTIDQDNSRINAGGAHMPLPLPNGETFDYPIDTVNTANLQVTAHARDGLTVAVGGMITQRITDAEEKVPVLGDIPILGHLFKKTVRSNSRKQIVLLITPHVLETPEESDALARTRENEARRLDESGRNEAGNKAVQGDSIFQNAAPAAPAALPEAGAMRAPDAPPTNELRPAPLPAPPRHPFERAMELP